MEGWNEAQTDPLDDQYWDYYEEGELIHYERCLLGCLLLHPLTMGAISNALDDHIYKYDPSLNIVSKDQLHPIVPVLDDCSIMVLQTVPPADLWDADEIVDIGVADEI
ncbi:hypothetical protein RHMOL_Rhmol10G0177200 [Rhododendron molle]|uniref:Uncharacterized protein n=1 Tax=Rhododendron molle TaxID=49168 RepID=A0ACC0M4H5_RHOML|nr:hypothetical protein RHMOL_Rhmol10G0177200 [Rhododendron molle]